MTDEQQHDKEKHRVEVYWTAVSYRTVTTYVAGILVIVLAVLYFIYPDRFALVGRKIKDAISGSGEPVPVVRLNSIGLPCGSVRLPLTM